MTEHIDTADTVHHKPTGEVWLVACVENGYVSWCGWPEGKASLSDCELITKGTATERDELLRQLAEMKEPDHRGSYARRILQEAA